MVTTGRAHCIHIVYYAHCPYSLSTLSLGSRPLTTLVIAFVVGEQRSPFIVMCRLNSSVFKATGLPTPCSCTLPSLSNVVCPWPILSPRTFLRPALDSSSLHPSPSLCLVVWAGRIRGADQFRPLRLCSSLDAALLFPANNKVYLCYMFVSPLFITSVGLCEVLDFVQCHYNTERQMVND